MKPISTVLALTATLFALGCAETVTGPDSPLGPESLELEANKLPGADNGGQPLSAELSGAAEVPGPGDPDGSGSAQVTLNHGQGEVCFVIEVADIDAPTAAHIHVGAAGVAGGVVVNFNVAVNGLSGCVAAEGDLIKAIRKNPAGYYVNVHNPAFPPGAVRGQLSK